MKRIHATSLAALFTMICSGLIAGQAHSVPAPTYEGPTAYTSTADSPYPVDDFAFCVETFEDGIFDVPGATINGSVVGPGGLIDSVDADDGSIDGSGTNGHSLFSQDGATGITVVFDSNRANGLPTEVGIVWTDGGAGGGITFEAFDKNGDTVLGPNGPNLHADNSNSGTTAEDRFYGATDFAGISKIRISNASGGIEVDHVQLNSCVLCGDVNQDFRLTASDALKTLKTSVGTDKCALCVCDANNNGSISASDALAVLKKSVGLSPTMNCPSCIFG